MTVKLVKGVIFLPLIGLDKEKKNQKKKKKERKKKDKKRAVSGHRKSFVSGT